MITHYEKGLFYQIFSTAKYFELLSVQFFKEIKVDINATEHLALCVIAQTKDCCQRDLAKVILKDRANTGKLAKKLEDKGLIKIETKEKNNKPVKILTITKKGDDLCKKISKKIEPLIDKIRKQMPAEKIEEVVEGIQNFRQIVKNTVKTNI